MPVAISSQTVCCAIGLYVQSAKLASTYSLKSTNALGRAIFTYNINQAKSHASKDSTMKEANANSAYLDVSTVHQAATATNVLNHTISPNK